LSTHKKSEVDLKVAQELKNHQDFMFQTNQAIQNLNFALVNLSIQHEKLTASLFSRLKNTEIKFENLEALCQKTLSGFGQKYSIFDKDFTDRINQIQSNIDELDKHCVSNDVFEDSINNLTYKLEGFKKSFEGLFNHVNTSLGCIHGKIESETQKVKQELFVPPQEFDPIKQKVDEILSALRVDCEGLIKEISLLKKSAHYTEKRFENIYTLIERLKEDK